MASSLSSFHYLENPKICGKTVLGIKHNVSSQHFSLRTVRAGLPAKCKGAVAWLRSSSWNSVQTSWREGSVTFVRLWSELQRIHTFQLKTELHTTRHVTTVRPLALAQYHSEPTDTPILTVAFTNRYANMHDDWQNLGKFLTKPVCKTASFRGEYTHLYQVQRHVTHLRRGSSPDGIL